MHLLFVYICIMKPKLKRLLQTQTETCPPDLEEQIYSKILKLQKRRSFISLSSLFLVFLASLASLVPVVKALSEELSRSGFNEYLSLLFSNGKEMITYWKEFSFILAESLPVATLVLTLALLFICLLSVRSFIKRMKISQLITV
jgi:hypothetical protein